MHAIGHIAANISFAAVAISLTHTVKTLEPAFNVVLSKLILGEGTPMGAVLSLIPIIVGVAMASAGELSFNWTGFLTAMASNLTFGFRAVWSKMWVVACGRACRMGSCAAAASGVGRLRRGQGGQQPLPAMQGTLSRRVAMSAVC
jgi:drug/metabolite transporter (DMT)-like permease